MLRSIKLSVDKPYIDASSTLAHSGTSYQVSLSPGFNVPNDIVINVNNSTVDLLEYRFQYDLQPTQPLYVRTRYHFNNNTISSWSTVVELSSNQVGMKSSSSIVTTPIISASIDYSNSELGELYIKLDNTTMYAGAGNIVATSWTVETTDGVPLYNLPHSADMINSIKLPVSIIDGHNALVCSAITHSDVNIDSNVAQTFIVITNNKSNYFIAKIKGELYLDSDNFISITQHAKSYSASDVRILMADGTLVEEHSGLDPYAAAFPVGHLTLTDTYIVEVRMQVNNGTPTPWIECYRGYANIRPTRIFNSYTNFDLSRFNFANYFNFEGLSAQTIQADEDGSFYMAIPGTTTLKEYRAQSGRVYEAGNTIDLGTNALFKIPNINYMKLHNGKVLIDHNMAINNGNIEVAAFSLFDYNHITKKLTYIKRFIRNDERYGTGRTGSAVVTKDNLIYYVPGEIFDSNNKKLDLELRVYDISTNTIIDNIPLPITGIKQNVALTEDKNGDIYMFGGTKVPVKSNIRGEPFATVLNHHIYKLDKIAKVWTDIGNVGTNNGNSYRYKLIPLRDNKFLVLNVTPTTLGAGNETSFIFDPSTGLQTNVLNNNPLQERIGISIELNNADICLISSTVDIVESVAYLKTTTSDAVTTTALISNSQRVINLVVPIGKTVYMRDPYLYDSITIDGTSLSNTGKLVWIRQDTINEFHYNDLIVTRPMTLTIPAGQAGPNYNTVVVVGDAVLNVIQQ